MEVSEAGVLRLVGHVRVESATEWSVEEDTHTDRNVLGTSFPTGAVRDRPSRCRVHSVVRTT